VRHGALKGAEVTRLERWPHRFLWSKASPIYASRKSPATGASAISNGLVGPSRSHKFVAGARSNDGNSSLLIERVGVVLDNIHATSHGGFASTAVQRNRPKPRLTGRSILGLKTKGAAVHKIAVLFEARPESRRSVPRDLGDVQQRVRCCSAKDRRGWIGNSPPAARTRANAFVPDGPPSSGSSTKGNRWSCGISLDHFDLEATALNVRPLERGVAPRGVPVGSNRGMGLISPSLNSSAAVVQVRCLILFAFG